MYKGLAQLVGMTKIEGPQTIAEQFERYLAEYDNYDFFFIHYKYTDKAGEDGNFEAKKKAIEDFDAALPILLRKKPDVIAITGDHSTPCAMKGHSWHPAARAAALGVERLGQAGTLHRDGREHGFARRLRGEVPHPPDAGQRADVRQVRGLILGPDRNRSPVAIKPGQRSRSTNERDVRTGCGRGRPRSGGADRNRSPVAVKPGQRSRSANERDVRTGCERRTARGPQARQSESTYSASSSSSRGVRFEVCPWRSPGLASRNTSSMVAARPSCRYGAVRQHSIRVGVSMAFLVHARSPSPGRSAAGR